MNIHLWKSAVLIRRWRKRTCAGLQRAGRRLGHELLHISLGKVGPCNGASETKGPTTWYREGIISGKSTCITNQGKICNRWFGRMLVRWSLKAWSTPRVTKLWRSKLFARSPLCFTEIDVFCEHYRFFLQRRNFSISWDRASDAARRIASRPEEVWGQEGSPREIDGAGGKFAGAQRRDREAEKDMRAPPAGAGTNAGRRRRATQQAAPARRGPGQRKRGAERPGRAARTRAGAGAGSSPGLPRRSRARAASGAGGSR